MSLPVALAAEGGVASAGVDLDMLQKKDPELVAINSDLSSVLVNALDKIPMDQRIIVELKNIEGRSHKEIAEILGISVTAAKVRLHRAHQKLRQILEEVER